MKKLIVLLIIPLFSLGQDKYGLSKSNLERSQLKTEIKGSVINTYRSDGSLYMECSYPYPSSYCKYFDQNGRLGQEYIFGEGDKVIELVYNSNGRITCRLPKKNKIYHGQQIYYCNLDSEYVEEFKFNVVDGKNDGLYIVNACIDNLRLNYYKHSPKSVKLYKKGELIKEIRSTNGDSYDPKIIVEPDFHLMNYDENLNITGSIKEISNYDLRRMVNFFLDNCKNYGIIIPNQNIKATFEELEGNTIALAMAKDNDDEIFIKVDPENWQNSTVIKRWYILYHELGHDVLNLSHGEGGKMMFNFVERNYSWDDFIIDRNEMFYNYLKYYKY